MEDINLYTMFFLIASGFLAAFIDSVVGGGGLISIPALLFTGLPPSTAIATNKLASSMGSLMSTISFIRSGNVNFKLVSKLFSLTFIGAILGAFVVKHISSEILKPLVLVLLIAVAIYTIMKKEWGKDASYNGMSVKKELSSLLLFLSLDFMMDFSGQEQDPFCYLHF